MQIVEMNRLIKSLSGDMSQVKSVENQSPRMLTRSLTVLPPISPKQSERFEQIIKTTDSQPNVMFTRLDAVQNIKRLKGAINRGYLDEQDLQVNKNAFNIHTVEYRTILLYKKKILKMILPRIVGKS
jgi:hypothetical protein